MALSREIKNFTLTRRDFLLSSVSALAIDAAGPAGAVTLHDNTASSSSRKAGQTVVNAGSSPLAFINMAHGLEPASQMPNFPGALTADGYPNGKLTSVISNGCTTDPRYYGRYLVWWSGIGCFQLSPPTIIYSGGAAVTNVTPSAKGTQPNGNFTLGVSASQPTQSSPVEFAFGVLIAAVGTNGGLIRFTTASSISFGNGFPSGTQFKFNNLTYNGGPFPTGPNQDGSWTITKDSATQFTLNDSSSLDANKTTIVAHGGPGTQTEGISSVAGPTYAFLANRTYSGFSNLVWCKKANQAAVIAGQLASPEYVSALQSMNPRFVRFMDFGAVQGDRSSSYTYRARLPNLNWGAVSNYVLDYYAGTITNSGSDVYTCSNPTASGSGPYAEGEVVVGQLGSSAANTGYTPTLNVGGRGAKPILSGQGSLLNMNISGSLPATGTTIKLTFTGGGLASPFVYHYRTSTSGKGPAGLLDTSFSNIALNIADDIRNNFRRNAAPLVAAQIFPTNPDVGGYLIGWYFNPNINSSGVAALNNGLMITGTDNGATPATYTFGWQSPSSLPNSTYFAFTHSKLLGGWVSTQGSPDRGAGVHGSVPIEFYIELCKRANVGMWLNIGPMWSDDRVYNTVLQIANAGVDELLLELSNETWNFGLQETRLFWRFGTALGLPLYACAEMGFCGLRTIQIAQQATAAWAAAGRSRSQLFIDIAYQFDNMNTTATSSTCTYKFNGTGLNASGAGNNVALKAFGGYGATALSSVDYSSAPNRPIDFADCAGGAPYWCGGQYNSGNSTGPTPIDMGVPLSAYNGLLLASYNYVNGTPAQKQAALDFCYTGGTSGTGDLYNGLLNGSTFNTDENLVAIAVDSGVTGKDGYCGIGSALATYDATRIANGRPILGYAPYEGGWFMGPIGSADSTLIASNLTSIGYTNGYTSSLPGAAFGGPTSTAAGDATNMATLLAAFKNDSRAFDLCKRYLTENIVAGKWNGSTSVNRMSLAAWYGFEGPNVWSIYPGTIMSVPTQAFNAIQAIDD